MIDALQAHTVDDDDAVDVIAYITHEKRAQRLSASHVLRNPRDHVCISLRSSFSFPAPSSLGLPACPRLFLPIKSSLLLQVLLPNGLVP